MTKSTDYMTTCSSVMVYLLYEQCVLLWPLLLTFWPHMVSLGFMRHAWS